MSFDRFLINWLYGLLIILLEFPHIQKSSKSLIIDLNKILYRSGVVILGGISVCCSTYGEEKGQMSKLL